MKGSSSSSCDSSADTSLFLCQDCGDDASTGGDDGDENAGADEYNNESDILAVKESQGNEEQPTAEFTQKSSENEPTLEEATKKPTAGEEENNVMDVVDDNCFDREEMIERAHRHVKMAKAQRLLYVTLVHKARQHVKLRLPFTSRSYTFVVDYGQNMELPVFNYEQPGCSYYYTPLGIYNLGMVDQAYNGVNGDEEPHDHMHAHVYHEGVGKKGANNVCSLIVKTLRLKNLLRENESGGELNVVFDNCSGQNKNNAVLKLMVWLTEMGYFKQVNFVFLVVGHTKNAADRIFNLLKLKYRKCNIYTMPQLVETLNESEHVTIHETQPSDFHDWETYLNHFYPNYSKSGEGGRIKQNQIFSCEYQSNRSGNKLNAHLKQSDLAEDDVVLHNTVKQGFMGRSNFPAGSKGFRDAVDARPAIMKDALSNELKQIECNGINIFKQVEMATKYKKIIPVEDRVDILYETPCAEVMNAVKKEKEMRKSSRQQIDAEKRKVSKKLKMEQWDHEQNKC
eukprot:scaffold21901_cov59-Cyclotella_meneghiniana.AAC.1